MLLFICKRFEFDAKTIPKCSPVGEIASFFFSVGDILFTRSTNPNQGECLSAQIVDELVVVSHSHPFRPISINNSVKTNLFVCFFKFVYWFTAIIARFLLSFLCCVFLFLTFIKWMATFMCTYKW